MKPPMPDDIREIRTLLKLSQHRFARLLGVSQGAVANAEAFRSYLPRKAFDAFALLRQGYPASDATGNRLASARIALALTPEDFAALLNVTPPHLEALEAGEEPIPWYTLARLAALEQAASLPPSFDPTEALPEFQEASMRIQVDQLLAATAANRKPPTARKP